LVKRADYTHLLKRNNSLLVRYQSRVLASSDQTAASRGLEQGARLARVDALMTKIVDATIDAVLTVDSQGRIETANYSAASIFDYPAGGLMRCNVDVLLPGFNQMIDHNSEKYRIGKGHFEAVALRKSGEEFPIDLALAETTVGAEMLFVLVIRDITELREHQAKLEHQALHDALTGLPNRILLANRTEHALASAARTARPVALFLLDLDRFKEVNDTLGHHVGDALLKDIAERLSQVIRPTDTVARLGGDEFAVLLPSVDTLDQAMELASRILAVFQSQFHLDDGIVIDVGCSIGIALHPQHGDEGSKLMQCADVAMYRAKAGPRKIVVYDQTKDTNSVRALTLSSELRQAIREGSLTMEFQPQLDLRSQKITSVEGLARWRHPTLGYVPPDEFIAHAEQGGLIADITRWTMETALSQLSCWASRGVDLALGINLSAKMLVDSTLPDLLRSMLHHSRVIPSRLIIEITESALMVDPQMASQTVLKLGDLGVRLSIDDYGTGYSSLAYLQRLPLDEIKIDKSFVFGMLETHNDDVIVRSTIDLAHNLGLEVVAEGVESPEHIEALARLHCDKAQGFGISPSLNPDMLDQWLLTANWLAPRRAA
jgi:diguanylate cyclase (GGDEF)-like protein/PAS domain S-box-containing protein